MLISHFTNKSNNNVYWHRIQLSVLKLINEHRQDWKDEFALIKVDFEKNISDLQEKNKINPLSSTYFSQILGELNNSFGRSH